MAKKRKKQIIFGIIGALILTYSIIATTLFVTANAATATAKSDTDAAKSQVWDYTVTITNQSLEIARMQATLAVYDKTYTPRNADQLTAVCGDEPGVSNIDNYGQIRETAWKTCASNYPSLN